MNPSLHKKLSTDPCKSIAFHPKKSCARKTNIGTGSKASQVPTLALGNKTDNPEEPNEDLEPAFREDIGDDDENILTSAILSHVLSGGQEQDGCLIMVTNEAEWVEDIMEAKLNDGSDSKPAIDLGDDHNPQMLDSNSELAPYPRTLTSEVQERVK